VKYFKVSGIFNMEFEAEDDRKAKSKAERILRDSGITGYVIETQEVNRDE